MAAPANLEKMLINALADRDAGRFVFNQLVGAGGLGTPAGTGVTAADGRGSVKTTLTLTNVVMNFTVTSGIAASLLVFNMPAGMISFEGASCDLTLVGSGLGATAAIVGGVGTAAAAPTEGTLTLAEQDIIPSTNCALAANAGTFKGKIVTATIPNVKDGTTTPVVVYLNFALPSSPTGTLTVNGTITITWANLGDN